MAKKKTWDNSVRGRYNEDGIKMDLIDKGSRKDGKKKTKIETTRGNLIVDDNVRKNFYDSVRTKAVYKNGVIARTKSSTTKRDDGVIASGVNIKRKFENGMPKKTVVRDARSGDLMSKTKYKDGVIVREVKKYPKK